MAETKDQNGTLYIGQESAKDGFFHPSGNHRRKSLH